LSRAFALSEKRMDVSIVCSARIRLPGRSTHLLASGSDAYVASELLSDFAYRFGHSVQLKQN
jgi:hypothetical protein